MSYIRLTKIFRFEMAHRLTSHQGLCKNIHGHSYELHVCIKGYPAPSTGKSSDGMVLDFSLLKQIINDLILLKFDHALVLNKNLNSALGKELSKINTKIVWLNEEPTCENLLHHFVVIISTALPKEVSLIKLKLYETNSSYAEWLKSDN